MHLKNVKSQNRKGFAGRKIKKQLKVKVNSNSNSKVKVAQSESESKF